MLTARAIATQGLGYSAPFVAVQGLRVDGALPPVVVGGGGRRHPLPADIDARLRARLLTDDEAVLRLVRRLFDSGAIH